MSKFSSSLTNIILFWSSKQNVIFFILTVGEVHDANWALLVTPFSSSGEANSSSDAAAYSNSSTHHPSCMGRWVWNVQNRSQEENFYLHSQHVKVHHAAYLLKHLVQTAKHGGGGIMAIMNLVSIRAVGEPLSFSCWCCIVSPVCKGAKADLVFVIDGSWSIGEESFKKVVHFVSGIIAAFDIVGPSGMQVSSPEEISMKTSLKCSLFKSKVTVMERNY